MNVWKYNGDSTWSRDVGTPGEETIGVQDVETTLNTLEGAGMVAVAGLGKLDCLLNVARARRLEAEKELDALLNYVRAFRAFADSAAYSPESRLSAHIRMNEAWSALPDVVREKLEGEER